jgi:hypothetical protein
MAGAEVGPDPVPTRVINIGSGCPDLHGRSGSFTWVTACSGRILVAPAMAGREVPSSVVRGEEAIVSKIRDLLPVRVRGRPNSGSRVRTNKTVAVVIGCGLLIAWTTGCGGGHQTAGNSATTAAPTNSVTQNGNSTTLNAAAAAYVQAVVEPISRLEPLNIHLDDACPAVVGGVLHGSVSQCITWGIGAVALLRGLIATVAKVSVPSGYGDANRRVLDGLRGDLARDTALLGVARAAPAGATRENDSALATAVSDASDQSQLLAAMRALDPNFSLFH